MVITLQLYVTNSSFINPNMEKKIIEQLWKGICFQ